MNRDCEQTLLSAMALRDGEEAPQSPEAVRNHLASCPSCRTEVAEQESLHARLAGMEPPRVPQADLWGSVKGRLGAPPAKRPTGLLVAGVAAAAVLLRVTCLVAAPEAAWLGSIAVVGAIALGFAVLRENPFRVVSGDGGA